MVKKNGARHNEAKHIKWSKQQNSLNNDTTVLKRFLLISSF